MICPDLRVLWYVRQSQTTVWEKAMSFLSIRQNIPLKWSQKEFGRFKNLVDESQEQEEESYSINTWPPHLELYLWTKWQLIYGGTAAAAGSRGNSIRSRTDTSSASSAQTPAQQVFTALPHPVPSTSNSTWTPPTLQKEISCIFSPITILAAPLELGLCLLSHSVMSNSLWPCGL